MGGFSCSTAGGTGDRPEGGLESGADVRGDVKPAEGAAKDAAKDASGEGGVPALTALSVSGSASDSSAPIELVPPFASDVFDYYVRCAPGANALTVSMTATAGSESSLLQPKASASLPMQTLAVSVNENDAIVAEATRGSASTEYWVRCLPHDFPPIQWTAHADAGPRVAGYYLVGNLRAPKDGAYAMVLDENGVPVWYDSVPTARGAFDVGNVVKGAVSFTPWTSPGSPYEIHELDTLKTTSVTVPSQDEHELQSLSNGDFLLIANPLLSGVDLTGLTLPLPDGGAAPLGPGSSILDCHVVEVDKAGTVVWQWVATDHLDPEKDCTWPQPAATSLVGPDGGTIVDTFHCNSIDVDSNNGNLLVSSRAMDSIFYIEKSTGRILWKMGGANFTKDDATYVPVVDPFHRQHDARLQPSWVPTCTGGTGQISLFDDETDLPGPARAVVYDVSIGSADGGTTADCGLDAGASSDGGASSASVAWQYPGEVSSASMGSFRLSSDGSRVVGWGLGGAPNLVFTEVDLAGERLLEMSFTNGNGSYRAIKVPPSAFDLSVLRSSAGLP